MLNQVPSEYRLVTALTASELNRCVNELVQHKSQIWVPLGPASMSMNDSGSFKHFAQTMVRYASKQW